MENPYNEPQVNAPLTGNDLFGNFRFIQVPKKQTERGELLKYFADKTGKPIGYIAMRCTKMDMQTLYFIKSSSDRYQKEGKGAWSKAFYGSLKIKS